MPIFMMCHYVQKRNSYNNRIDNRVHIIMCTFLHMTHDIYFMCVLWKHARILYVLIFVVYIYKYMNHSRVFTTSCKCESVYSCIYIYICTICPYTCLTLQATILLKLYVYYFIVCFICIVASGSGFQTTGLLLFIDTLFNSIVNILIDYACFCGLFFHLFI